MLLDEVLFRLCSLAEGFEDLGSLMNPFFCSFLQSFLEQVKGKSDLLRVLDDYGVGDHVTLTVRRGAETLEVTLPLEEANI